MTNQNLTQQKITNFDELYDQALISCNHLESVADEILEALKKQHPIHFKNVYFEIGQIKDKDTAQQKIKDRYHGEVTKITDIVRGRFVTQTPEHIKLIEEMLSSFNNVTDIKNRFESPIISSGYRNITSSMKLPNGHITEIQVVNDKMLEIDSHMHQQMEEVRQIKYDAYSEDRHLRTSEKKKIKRINKTIKEVANQTAEKAGINTLLLDDLKEKFSNQTINPSKDTTNKNTSNSFNCSALGEEKHILNSKEEFANNTHQSVPKIQ